jgi:hypothetical protein
MNKNESGWGAFQNLKTENQKLKKEIIIQNENNYGERISIDKYNNFRNISSRVNPFRFPDSIKNEVLEKEYFKKEEEEKEKKIEKEVTEEENEYKFYKKLIIKKQKQVDEIINQNLNYKKDFENKIKIIEEEYKLNILNNNTKISKIQTHIDNLQKIIETNDDLTNDIINDDLTNDIINDLTNNNNKSVIVIPEKTIEVLNTPENIVLESDETNSKKINKNRPETIKGCFNTDTLIRHKKSGFEEFCIYIVNEGCLFRCDQNGIYDKNSIRYSKLNQFTSDNYKKNSPNRTQRNNAYVETEYLCKISNKFLPLIDLQKGIIYN